jgi:hypothetical protein
MDSQAFVHKLIASGLSLGHWYILVACGYGPYPYEFHVREALSEADSSSFGRLSEAEVRETLRICISQGLVRIISEKDLLDIRARLAAEGRLGPVYGMPTVGAVDFTIRGAECYQALCKDFADDGYEPSETYHVRDDSKEAIYCPTFRDAQTTTDYYNNLPDVQSVSQPVPLGPWCVYWWECFPSGYRVDVEYQSGQEQGKESP